MTSTPHKTSLQGSPRDFAIAQRRRGQRLSSMFWSSAMAAGLASIGLAISFNSTAAALLAQITNVGNTAGTPSDQVVMEEYDGDSTAATLMCKSDGSASASDTVSGVNQASCTLNKYVGTTGTANDLTSGNSHTRTITLKNTGTSAVNTAVKFSGCTPADVGTAYPGANGDPCSTFTVQITPTLLSTATGTVHNLAAATPANLFTSHGSTPFVLVNSLSAGGAVKLEIVLTYPTSSLAIQNSLIGRKLTQDIIWSFETAS